MQPVPEGFHIEELSGPGIVAYLMHWGLFGTLSVQLYLYYLAFPKDRKFIKYLVYGIYIIEFVQTVLFTHDAFAIFGYGFGDIDALTGMHFNWLTIPIMGALRLSGRSSMHTESSLYQDHELSLYSLSVSLTSSVAGIIDGAYCFSEDNIADLTNDRRVSIAVGIWCSASALCDVIIAICMTYYLMRNNTSLRCTQILVSSLIRLTIETGTMTAVAVLLSLILFLAFPHETFYAAIVVIVPNLYANTILMMLNSRIRIVGGRDTYTSSGDMIITTTTMMKGIISQSTKGTQPADTGIQGQVSVVAITQNVFNDKLFETKEKPQNGSISLSV
ncbi:hypothetical protein IW261DRAFT_1568771 [Armillaria novae-zelandiae]|uniref:DUF6534 domain-containing protein n=1 Tax=Armillaria novae-zelandiae TaxID=153914 RepID=A0AA39NZ65_9AGAR|nr:hypothetical protein IW261DRAFT_1568771 [Armillaria novae-zelandiae]